MMVSCLRQCVKEGRKVRNSEETVTVIVIIITIIMMIIIVM